jgi:DNA-directed RNA polymerase specialized sigma24 family protein
LNAKQTTNGDEMRSFLDLKRKASKEQIKFISAELNELPAHEAVIIYLYFWEDCDFRTIAPYCGMSASLVKKIFDIALMRLRVRYSANLAALESSYIKKEVRSYVA